LFAAEIAAAAGHAVTIYERKPSPGRKFLMAGRGGLNLTHSETLEIFLTRYGAARWKLAPAIERFSPGALRDWCEGLGEPVFVGTSGRVFPKSLKASPLLRALVARLESKGARILTRHEWTGWDGSGNLAFITPEGAATLRPDATLLALGGASWPKLGSDGGWEDILQRRNVPLSPLRPSNCGFSVAWSELFRNKFAGQPLKTVALSFGGVSIPGDVMITRNGIEGGPVYALSAALRDADAGETMVAIDLRPALTPAAIMEKLSAPRGSKSFSTWMQKALGLPPVAISLLREADPEAPSRSAGKIAALIKAVPLRLGAPFPLERAVSTAGGIKLTALTQDYMLKDMPGVFAAGEMLDWEAPTGGYLLQATFATAFCAAHGMLKWLDVMPNK